MDDKGKYVEIDETCIARHHREKPTEGATQWVFGGIERGDDGLMFAFRVRDPTKKTLYPLIRKHIRPGTTIISDGWPAYRNLESQWDTSTTSFARYFKIRKHLNSHFLEQSKRTVNIFVFTPTNLKALGRT